MKNILETMIYFIIILWIAIVALSSGNLDRFIAPEILVPFALLASSLLLFTFGWDKIKRFVMSVTRGIFQRKTDEDYLESCHILDTAILYSYISIGLWILNVLVMSQNFSYTTDQLQALVSQIALAVSYAFVVSEFILRPIKKRLESINF